jgi:transcriptional regulator with GAF, ATPase, and Fis domain
MNPPDARGTIRIIWGVVCAFAVSQIVVSTWPLPAGPQRGVLLQALAAWASILIVAIVSTRYLRRLDVVVSGHEKAHTATLQQLEQLELSNAVLQVVARSVDVPLAFQTLAQRIVRLVPCDRVGLAVLSENGQEFQTYTARVNKDERRVRPRPDIVFRIERTALGTVLKSREPLFINDTSVGAADFLDVNVLHSSGVRSALLLPLLTKGRAVGTLNVVSRQLAAFEQQHIEILQPIAEIFAVAHVAQQLHVAVGKYHSMEAMSELTLSIATEINSALQTIIGHCDLLSRGYPDPDLQQDLATVVYQAQRISRLLDKMRAAANERLREVAEAVSQGGIPSSPEAFEEPDAV